MNAWLQKQVDSGFADFKGLSVEATVPLRDSLVNELLGEALRSTATARPASAGSAPDVRPLLRFVDKAEVRTTDGVMVLHVSVNVR